MLKHLYMPFSLLSIALFTISQQVLQSEHSRAPTNVQQQPLIAYQQLSRVISYTKYVAVKSAKFDD